MWWKYNIFEILFKLEYRYIILKLQVQIKKKDTKIVFLDKGKLTEKRKLKIYVHYNLKTACF